MNEEDEEMPAALAVAGPMLMMTCPVEDPMPEQRVVELLYNWEIWHRSSNWKVSADGYPKRAAGKFQTSYAHGKTLEEMYAQMDARLAGVVEAIVNDLPNAQRIAVHHTHLEAAFRLRGYPGEVPEAVIARYYRAAKVAIRGALIRRGIP